jgi:peptidyl-dipeptidase A
MKKILFTAVAAAFLLSACGDGGAKKEEGKGDAEAQAFLDTYTKEYVQLYTNSSEAQWKANTEIKDGDTTNATNAQKADEAMAAFTGSKENIEAAKKFLKEEGKLSPIQKKQFEVILYAAANNPQTIADVVKARIKAETDQTQKLYGYQDMLGGKKVSTNDLDDILKKETDLNKRLEAWEASKAIGPSLKDGLVRLRDLRNQTVNALDYPD